MSVVLILGGYGAVGREAALALSGRPDMKVIVGGRHPDRARPIPGVTSVRVDAADPADLATSLEGITTVLMCAEVGNDRVARACLERGIGYVDVSASHDVLTAIEELDDLATAHGATAALSVGLVPGVTNLLARVVAERSPDSGLDIGVLLGSGEQHGSAAVAWTLDGLGVLEGSWTTAFPEPYGARTVHRFPFSDQYTLPRTIAVPSARTGLCLDSRLFTTLLAAARRPAVAGLLRRPRIRELLLKALAKIHLGSDGFAVTVSAGTAQASLSGHSQSRATGRAAALLVRHLPGLPAGVRHIEQLVDPLAFLTELAAAGFVLDVDN
ncbi:saccharopine dehydrogenase NADP-binding domain-containing protein [Nonomuraea wenchangensis]|uniref:saccharopine dehydrogenase family protein n=1 Tax=Nonomuraea wenchangensis TaxID=568860 RepID=UPI00342D36AE